MEKKQAAAFAVLLLAGGAWWYFKQQRDAAAAGAGDASSSAEPFAFDVPTTWSLEPIISSAGEAVRSVYDTASDVVTNAISPGSWTPPASAGPYLAAIDAAEIRNAIPHNLLARLLYQESRFRPDIINGGPNSAGAIGIAQIVPKWHPGVDPSDAFASIDYAAGYLAQLRGQTGSWQMALAAYNWGIGNLQQKGFAAAPLETRNYVAQISEAIGLA